MEQSALYTNNITMIHCTCRLGHLLYFYIFLGLAAGVFVTGATASVLRGTTDFSVLSISSV